MKMCERNSYIQGYHVYRAIWDWAIGEDLVCKREPNKVFSVFTTRGPWGSGYEKVYSQDYEVHEAYEQFKCVVASNLNTVYQMMCKVLYIIHL